MTVRLVQLATTATLAPAGDRRVRGLIVPFGVPTRDHRGIRYDADSLRWSEDVTRIPLLFQHDHDTTIGHAVELERTPAGIVGTFAVEDSPTGDRLVREATAGSRTGFSIGVLADPDSVDEWWEAGRDEVVALRGELYEVSHVSAPAFDDARIDEVVEGARPATPEPSAGLAGGSSTVERTAMTHRTTASALVTADLSAPPTAAPVPAAAATPPATAPAPAPAAPAEPVAQRAAEPMPALAGAAHVTAEPAVYFEGGEHSFVRDAWRARFDVDTAAADRLRRFNAQLVESAVAVRSGFAEIIPPGYRGELLIPAIDRGRPIVSRLGEARIPLVDATPFKIPAEGDFDGVGDHVEGTAHVASGTLTVDDVTISPKAISGAFEVSRELVDASNPAIDRIALNAMLRDYRTTTEAYAATTYGAGAPVTVNGGDDLELDLLDFLDDRDAVPAFIAAHPGFYGPVALEKASDGRPKYPTINPVNTNGQAASQFRGVSIQGVDMTRAGQVASAKAIGILPEDVLWGESNVATFRFDEVLGPGVIKLALWAYVAAAVVRSTGVRVWAYEAPTP